VLLADKPALPPRPVLAPPPRVRGYAAD